MTNVVNSIQIVGRIECSRSNTSQSLYVTIVPRQPNQADLRLLTAQSTDQSWCLVKTTSMKDCFIICSYPTMDRVMVATNDPVVGYGEAKHIRVERLTTPIKEGEPLPIDTAINKIEFYQFRMEPENCGGNYLCSLSNIFPNTVMQGGYQTTGVSNPPNVNDFVTIHNRQGLMREWFWFEKNPTGR